MKRFTVLLCSALVPATAGAPALAESLGASTCCAPSPLPGCDDPACEALVCDDDPFCCDEAWDVSCALDALAGCACFSPADLDLDGDVDILDLLILLAAFGPCPVPPAPCPADIDGDGAVGIVDLLMLLSDFGP